MLGMARQMRTTAGGRTSRLGFSLVELLVVIAIIGVLVGLLVVVLGRAQASVRESAIATEVASLTQGLQAFKTQYNTDFPPDFSTGVPQGTNQQIINQYLTRLFRYRNIQTDVPIPNPAMPPVTFDHLDPAEALYFWLRGFTNDPANPLFGPPANRDPSDPWGVKTPRTPITEFDMERLRDDDGDGIPEYYPRFANERPYVYYVHYNYVRNFVKPANELVVRQGINTANLLPAPRPYLSRVAAVATGPTAQADPNQLPVIDPTIKQNYAGPDSFQIISAGMDNNYGVQVDSSNKTVYEAYAYPNGPYPDKPHRDNITSFTTRTLEDALP